MTALMTCAFWTGSSPRVRGTPGQPGAGRWLARFIPARAGNTSPDQPPTGERPVHPRACGEHRLEENRNEQIDGSSPRVRGTHAAYLALAVGKRFIPARAGNTRAHSPAVPPGPVHPRACGEHSASEGGGVVSVGSSPRVRGTRRGCRGRSQVFRFIPARAGNTIAARRWKRAWPVHPRACGEHAEYAAWKSAAAGSSPRVRGTPRLRGGLRGELRFIPARAGNTCMTG